MRRIWIDFQQPASPGIQALRLAFLILGGCMLAYALMRQHQVSSERTALLWQQQNLARLESRRIPMLQTAQENQISPEESKRAHEVLHQLNQPWDALFRALEQAVGPGIHVLAVTPDVHKGSITLKATAPTTDAALDFIERLRASPALTSVHFVNQEILVDSKQQPLLFTVNADWSTAP